MEFSRQEHWSGLPFTSPEELPNPGIEPWSHASQADSLPFELQESLIKHYQSYNLLPTPCKSSPFCFIKFCLLNITSVKLREIEFEIRNTSIKLICIAYYYLIYILDTHKI